MTKHLEVDFEQSVKKTTHCGYVAIVGRPNVGKSTLLNQILGAKISITADKPQTTRQNILGIKTHNNYQTIYVDTPGMQHKEPRLINRYMNKAAISALIDVNVAIFMIDGTNWREADELVLQKIANLTCPVILAINKVDKISDKKVLLAHIEKLNQKRAFAAIIPLVATTGVNVPQLEIEIKKLLPESPFYFPADQLTDRNERFLAAEIIREKLTRNLGEELPYALSVVIDQFTEETQKAQGILRIAATIIVEKPGQKLIVIGKNGAVLKKVGTLARKDMEHAFGKKVFLQLWVKIKNNWADDERALKSLGLQICN